MNKPINWNEVTVGETEIRWCGAVYRVMGLRDSWAWLLRDGNHFVYSLAVIEDVTTYDPWEDVSHECRFDDEFCVYHGRHMLIEDDIITGRYKRDETGLRVWKRKEG